MIYRTRMVTVQARQWTGDNEAEIQKLAGADRFYTIDPEDRADDPDATAALLETEHSTWVDVHHGDWVVRAGTDLRRMTDAAFHAQYEPVGTEPGA